MKTYLVGGAVRDALLGRPVGDRDWVVVGATPAQLRRRGFRQIGRDFPVFLHPRTGEEHALARTERSTGSGHGDFVCNAAPDVTLEEDLARRDLTINAMARAQDGTLVDPFGGRRDIAARLLRHVSPAFAEDPLRVFRVARFAAQLPGFRVHAETLTLMASMTPALVALPAERVYGELQKAASAPATARFFAVVAELGGTCWFEDLDLAASIALFSERGFPSADVALAALGWVDAPCVVDQVLARLRAPRLIHRAAVALATHRETLTERHAEPAELHDALVAIGAFRQGAVAALVLDAAACCAGRSLDDLRQHVGRLRRIRVDVEPGPDYGRALRAQRIASIEGWQLASGR